MSKNKTENIIHTLVQQFQNDIEAGVAAAIKEELTSESHGQ
jgi:hypothetical protein